MKERKVGTTICVGPAAIQLTALFKHSLYRTENNIRLKFLRVIIRALSNFLNAIKMVWNTISHDCCQWTFPPMLAALALTLRQGPAKTLLVLNFSSNCRKQFAWCTQTNTDEIMSVMTSINISIPLQNRQGKFGPHYTYTYTHTHTHTLVATPSMRHVGQFNALWQRLTSKLLAMTASSKLPCHDANDRFPPNWNTQNKSPTYILGYHSGSHLRKDVYFKGLNFVTGTIYIELRETKYSNINGIQETDMKSIS